MKYIHRKAPSSLLGLFLLVWPFTVYAEPCSPCPDPNDSYDPDLDGNPLTLPSVGSVTCGFVKNLLPIFPMEQGDESCQGIQAFGTYCGCPVQENACGLCEGYNKNTDIKNLFGQEGFDATCEIVNAYMQSVIDGTQDCLDYHSAYDEICGCEALGGDNDNEDDGDNGDTDDDSEPPPVQELSLCWDGSPIPDPDKDISNVLVGSTSDSYFLTALKPVLAGLNVTCGLADNFAKQGLFPPGIAGSKELRWLSGICGCPAIQNACNFCPQNDTVDGPFPVAQDLHGIDITCSQMYGALAQFPKGTHECWSTRSTAHTCGCNGGVAWYLGADTEHQHKALAWIPRITGFASFLGSSYIIVDILRQTRRSTLSTRFSTYQLILLGMSVFDISSSTAWMVSSTALPKYDLEHDTETEEHGTRGNEATCKAQGFFLELGFVGSTAFTASLTIFYVLTIIYGYREQKMKRLRKYFLAIPSVLAISLACAAIPTYEPFHVACFVANPNTQKLDDGGTVEHTWLHLIFYSVLPVGIALLISVCNLAAILRFVVKQNQRARKWRFSSQPNANQQQAQRPTRSKTEIAVFWQAFWYIMAFLLTWVIYLIGLFKPYFSDNDAGLYTFWVTLLVLNPLMGFWNAFVYAKPWMWDVWAKIGSFCKSSKSNDEETDSMAKPTNSLGISSGTSKHPSSANISNTSASLTDHSYTKADHIDNSNNAEGMEEVREISSARFSIKVEEGIPEDEDEESPAIGETMEPMADQVEDSIEEGEASPTSRTSAKSIVGVNTE